MGDVGRVAAPVGRLYYSRRCRLTVAGVKVFAAAVSVLTSGNRSSAFLINENTGKEKQKCQITFQPIFFISFISEYATMISIGDRVIITPDIISFEEEFFKSPFTEYRVTGFENGLVHCSAQFAIFQGQASYPQRRVKLHPVQCAEFVLDLQFEEEESPIQIPTVNDWSSYFTDSSKNFIYNLDDYKNFVLTTIDAFKKSFEEHSIDLTQLFTDIRDVTSGKSTIEDLIRFLSICCDDLNNCSKNRDGQLYARYRLEYSHSKRSAHLNLDYVSIRCAYVVLIHIAIIHYGIFYNSFLPRLDKGHENFYRDFLTSVYS